jgi:hypothetical protein
VVADALPASVAWTNLAHAVLAIRRGTLERAVASADRRDRFMLELASVSGLRHAGQTAAAELAGLAISDVAAAGDIADLQPARAIRRALADGRLGAADVDYVAVDTSGSRGYERAAHAAERGLGRFASGAVVDIREWAVARSVIAVALAGAKSVSSLTHGEVQLEQLVESVRTRLAGRSVRVAVALSIGERNSLALAFGRPG